MGGTVDRPCAVIATAAASSDVELVELYTAHHLPTTTVASLVPLFSAVALALLSPLLLVVLTPFLVLLATAPNWLRKQAVAQGQEILERGCVVRRPRGRCPGNA